MGHWHYAQIEIEPSEALLRSTISGPVDSHAAAHQGIQDLLDRLVSRSDELHQAAAIWKRGARDDTVIWRRFVWTLFECDDCRPSAQYVLDQWARVLKRSKGLKLNVEPLPPEWP
ncbi:MAG TPA: hypothetical protein VE172_22080 [Stackebrandtia sp.]|jgi:hypothetical protein|uniref:hypothetical protein n=1 Tax=Stackebrandtia sp. TaxID=2023065 RepID=UPI002D721C82|nr:hypothetical protein [Stackebrandtia sp.]HZE41498.1 hypothetical protein [Stackebrandtia sp.]